MFIYSCNAPNNNFYNSIILHERVITIESFRGQLAVIFAEVMSQNVMSSGSVRIRYR